MRIGSITIDPLLDGEFSAPGGAFYTNVTEEDWEPHRHFLDECTGNLTTTVAGQLLRIGDRVIVVDTGNSPQPTFPFVGGAFRSALTSAGVKLSEVTDVIFSHLHLDHIGWASLNGKPFFPNATYRCDRRDWDFFMDPDYQMPEWETSLSDPSRDAAAVRLAPVADRMEFFEGDDEVLTGIRSIEASGHTPGSTVLELHSDGEKGMLLGDLVHAEPELISDKRWDFFVHMDAEAADASLDRVRKRLIDEKLPFVASHFTGLRWSRIVRDQGKLAFEDVSG